MMNLPAITSEFTKAQIKIVAKHFIEEVLDSGRIIESADLLAKMELLIKEMRQDSDFIDSVRTEITKYGKNYTTATGTKIELAEVGTKYDFTQCGDKELIRLEAINDELEIKISDRKAFLKTIPIGGIEVVDADGEVCTYYQPIKTSTSSIKTTISK